MKKTILALATLSTFALAMPQNAMATPKGKTLQVVSPKMDATKTIFQNLAQTADCSKFTQALEATGLNTLLQGSDNYTVFAPNNEAFAALAPGTLASWLQPENKEKLVAILKTHIVEGKLDLAKFSSMLKEGGGMTETRMLNGQVLRLSSKGEFIAVKVNAGHGGLVISKATPQKNGIIYIVNRVLQPE
ncbi:MAG: fasciclin domain-containing protein [Bacteroidetes bacterium]|nr:fasciclin domain-containing protein [Bacteroidota bacterium]